MRNFCKSKVNPMRQYRQFRTLNTLAESVTPCSVSICMAQADFTASTQKERAIWLRETNVVFSKCRDVAIINVYTVSDVC